MRSVASKYRTIVLVSLACVLLVCAAIAVLDQVGLTNVWGSVYARIGEFLEDVQDMPGEFRQGRVRSAEQAIMRAASRSETGPRLPVLPAAGVATETARWVETPWSVDDGFWFAVIDSFPVSYARATGSQVTSEQLDALRKDLLGDSTVVRADPDELLCGYLPNRYYLPFESDGQDSEVQWGLVQAGPDVRAVVWTRSEDHGQGWRVVEAGRAEGVSDRLMARYLKAYEGLQLISKPVIYLYPQRTQPIRVRLRVDGVLTTSLPAVDESIGGWDVVASPDGSVWDDKGRLWPYLFWEASCAGPWDLSTGSCVSGRDTERFLDTALGALGLSGRDKADFLDYWVPRLRANRYNLIHFEGPAYEERARLHIDPRPDTTIRVLMVYRALDRPVDIEPQVLATPERRGFTVVEWGATEVE